jgi:hypothetical protein
VEKPFSRTRMLFSARFADRSNDLPGEPFPFQEATMTPRSIRRAAERKANKQARKAGELSVATFSAPAHATSDQSSQTHTPSEAQLTANRANAQFSTGPITAAGKRKSSANALTTGLTGRTVLLPTEDAARYHAHLQNYEAHFQPATPEEQALVQSLADTSWRLARIPGLEMNIYAQGHIEFADEFAEQDEAIRPALIEAHTYLAYEKQIRNLNLQEARLVRRREKETTELRRLQQERASKPVATAFVPKNASTATTSVVPTESGLGFDFSTGECASDAEPPTTQIPPSAASQFSHPLAA